MVGNWRSWNWNDTIRVTVLSLLQYMVVALDAQFQPFGRTGVDDVPTILALGRCGINFVWKSTLLLWHIAYLISYIAAKVHIFYVISKLFAER